MSKITSEALTLLDNYHSEFYDVFYDIAENIAKRKHSKTIHCEDVEEARKIMEIGINASKIAKIENKEIFEFLKENLRLSTETPLDPGYGYGGENDDIITLSLRNPETNKWETLE